MGKQPMRRLAQDRNAALDELEAELLGNPETATVTVAGQPRPFLLCLDGFERAAAAGHDPVPVIARLVSSIMADDTAKARLAETDVEDATALAGSVASVLTSAMLSDLAVVLYAGFLPFERDLRLTTLRARLTLGSVVSIVTEALPRIVTFLDLKTAGDAAPAGTPPADADGAEGNA